MHTQTCDILIVGSGIAGLSFALHCATHLPDKTIVMVSKGPLEESNTRYAQGGIAAVMDQLTDSYQQHIRDTLESGDGLCNPAVVEMVVREAPERMRELMQWGVNFDRHGAHLDLGREGGHSYNRILHCKDHTGASIANTLLQRCREFPNISLYENHFVPELITATSKEGLRCQGALISSGSNTFVQNAHYTMLACGGGGRLYERTSNPRMATGDGMALGLRAGATLRQMAYIQFHPTTLFNENTDNPFLISEAVRGFGGVLRNDAGEEFMYKYDRRGSLATRDVVSRAIYREMQLGNKPHVWLDLRHLNSSEFAEKFPTIYQELLKSDIDISKAMIPVVPAAHYFCGGIATDSHGRTGVGRLLACGECAGTGLHGANRLASNSLLEALVFSWRAADKLRLEFCETPFIKVPEVTPHKEPLRNDYDELASYLRHIMTAKVGIIRTEEGLNKALEELSFLLQIIPPHDYSRQGREFYNQVLVALAVVDDSMSQTENRGGLFREDLAENISTLHTPS